MRARYIRAALVASVAAALSLAAAPRAFAAAISVSSVTASGTFWTYDVNNLINGSGLAGSLHDGVWQHKWLSDGTPTATLVFDLGSVQSVSHAQVWNYGPGCCGDVRSVKNLDVLVSVDGATFTAAGSFVLGLPHVDPFPAEVLTLGTQARYVQFALLSNYGEPWFIGLSEVKFDDDADVQPHGPGVPEPASLLLLGAALMGLARRARRWRR